MKILQVLDSYPPDLNGGAYFTHRLAKQLLTMGHDVLVICPSRSPRSHYDYYEGVKLFRVKSYPALLYKKFRICLPIAIRSNINEAIVKFQPDIVHLQGRFILGDICMKLAERQAIPMLATNHFMPENFFHYTRLPSFMYAYFSRKSYAWVKGMFDKAIIWTAPTLTAAQLLKENGFEKNIHAISCGIDLTVFKPRAIEKPIADNLPVLLYAGRLDPEKNISIIIDALNCALKIMPCRLIIVGDGSEKVALQKYVSQLGLTDSVCFSGYLSDSDYPSVFSQADCFIHAGTAELQSIVTLEALASGLPVVAAKSVALPELVHHGLNGFLFEPQNAPEAAGFICKIFQHSDLKRNMAKESLNIARQHDVMLTGEKFVALYKQATKYNQQL